MVPLMPSRASGWRLVCVSGSSGTLLWTKGGFGFGHFSESLRFKGSVISYDLEVLMDCGL